MSQKYSIQLEISGPSAMWTRPDTGDAPVSYPAPTCSAVKGIFETILWVPSVEVVPTMAEICSPIVFHTYTTNYGGPLRKSRLTESGDSFQLLGTVLINVCYRLYAVLQLQPTAQERLPQRTQDWMKKTTNPEHAHKDMFNRRLKRGQCHEIPCLGWKEFTPDYVGHFREGTQACSEINLDIPSMLYRSFSEGFASRFNPSFKQNVRIEKGVLRYVE